MEVQRQIYPNSFSVISIQEHIFILSCTIKTRHIMAKVLCSPIKKSNHRILLICPNRTKQEVHGPHCSPEKQFKSINTYDYVITLIKRRKKPLLSLWKLNGSSLRLEIIYIYIIRCFMHFIQRSNVSTTEKDMVQWQIQEFSNRGRSPVAV